MAVNIGNTILPGYVLPLGDKYLLVFDHSGPTSYTSYVASTGLGGDVIAAFGGGLNLGGWDYFDDGVDSTGQFQVFPVLTGAGYGNSVPSVTLVYYSLVTATLGGQAQTAGAQVVAATNLSTFSFRLRALSV